MGNLARFTINGTPSDPPGFDATPSQAWTFRLEQPSGVLNRWTLQVFDSTVPDSPSASKSAPAVSLVGATTGTRVDAATPTSAITAAGPATRAHSYTFRSMVNGGINALGQVDPDYVFERVISIRTADGRRKIVADEETAYAQRGVSDAQNELVDALANTTPLLMIFLNATTRHAQALTVADLGRRGLQLDTAKVWDVVPSLAVPGTYTWGDNAGPEASFNGDFGALALSYGLTVRSYRRGDLGVTGTTGTGKSSWAIQSGDGSAMTPGASNASNGIGAVGAGLNGKASVVTDGTTQNGQYTHPTAVAPGTTPHHIYAVEQLLATAFSGAKYVHSANTNPAVICVGGQTAPAANLQWGDGGGVMLTTGVQLNQWYRILASMTGGASDAFRVGAHVVTPTATGTGAPGTQWGFSAAYNGTSLSQIEALLLMHLEGTLANFNLFVADADAKIRAFWSTAIEI